MTPAVQPLVLVANADKWLTESLESVLTQGGYQVLATARRQQVLEQARSHRPDGILLDLGLDRRVTDSFALCRALRADPSVSRATPIILMTAGPALRMQQIEALRAGAWELRGDPLDMEELVLRLGIYVQGKLEVDRLGAEALVDRASGLYNGAGVTRRAAELAALAVRQGTPMACAVFKPADDGDTMMPGAADRLAQGFRCSALDEHRSCVAPRADRSAAPDRPAARARRKIWFPTRFVIRPSDPTSSRSPACGRW